MTRWWLVLCLGATGCASSTIGFTTAPTILNVSGYVANERPLLWQDAAGCHLVVKFSDGQTLTPVISEEVCRQGALWMKAQAAVPKPSAAPSAAPDDAK